jgi:hypothetical protein
MEVSYGSLRGGFYKRGCQEKTLPLFRMEMEKVVSDIQPRVRHCCGAWRCAVSRSISCCVLRAVLERLQAAWRQCANHGSIGDSRPSVKLARWLAAERLGCLWLTLLGVEAFSFLPNAQGNGGEGAPFYNAWPILSGPS